MQKRFNITGVCYPERHYMMDISQKMREMMPLIEYGEYFTINRPRQYGKTTTLKTLSDMLRAKKEYLPIRTSFEDLGNTLYKDEVVFCRTFIDLLGEAINLDYPDLARFLQAGEKKINSFRDLSKLISAFVRESAKKVVLLVDEVDSSANHRIFLGFLSVLRHKYLNRYERGQETFHTVVLAGVHDIKTLKLKLRPDDSRKYNSPWNIAADFNVRMSYIPSEIVPMLEEYSQLEGVKMNAPVIAERLFYHTAGYPFLVSKLCKIIAETLIPQREEKSWASEDIDEAVQVLLKEDSTNFDSLIKNLENNQDLYDLVYRVSIDGDTIPFNHHLPSIHQGVLYGIFKNNGRLKIHNRIYEQLIYDYMISKVLTTIQPNKLYGEHFQLADNALDMKLILLKFQQFMKEQYSTKNKDFLEQHGRVLFLAFLSPILNGQGYSFREVQTSLEKRLDVIVTYFQHRYILELKRWYGTKAHEKGLDQLADYLEIHDEKDGFLLIFDDRKDKTWAQQSISHRNKTIFTIWV